MAGDPSTFSFMYLVDFSNPAFTVVDADGDSGNGFTAAEQDVTAKDEIQDGPTDAHARVGEIPNDLFNLHDAGSLDGTYVFVSLADDGNGHTGFIAQNQDTGAYYFLTNDQI